MTSPPASVLPSIRTLPLPDKAQELFSRAVCLVKQRPAEFASVGAWLVKHYSEAALRALCERTYRQDFASRLRLLRLDSPTYNRRLALQCGRPLEDLKQETIREAHLRGQRLKGRHRVTRTHPDAHPDEKVVDKTNAHIVWAWEDEQYRRRFQQIKAERKAAKLAEHDHPEAPSWRLGRAVDEIIEAEYPDPPEHVEHSRRIVGIASLLVWPEPLPMLGELGLWEWKSKPDTTWKANFADPLDDLMRNVSKPPTQDGPHATPLNLSHARVEGREGVLFQRMPGEPREVQHRWGDLSGLNELLHLAVDELEGELPPATCETSTPSPADSESPARPKLTRVEANVKARDFLREHPNATVRELAAGIGCSGGLVSKLPAWRAVNEQRKKGRQPKKVAVVSLTPKLERAAGIEDQALTRLIDEQAADAEPSPLDDEPQSDRQGMPRKAKVYRKR